MNKEEVSLYFIELHRNPNILTSCNLNFTSQIIQGLPFYRFCSISSPRWPLCGLALTGDNSSSHGKTPRRWWWSIARRPSSPPHDTELAIHHPLGPPDHERKSSKGELMRSICEALCEACEIKWFKRRFWLVMSLRMLYIQPIIWSQFQIKIMKTYKYYNIIELLTNHLRSFKVAPVSRADPSLWVSPRVATLPARRCLCWAWRIGSASSAAAGRSARGSWDLRSATSSGSEWPQWRISKDKCQCLGKENRKSL